ncbi:hypothetical protein LX36DRAFT_386984 [Colletotrichum falcatum]|nr:hypothetical protein LX36DRAFT_386984 [Colletotrichum falcatum]
MIPKHQMTVIKQQREGRGLAHFFMLFFSGCNVFKSCNYYSIAANAFYQPTFSRVLNGEG